MKDVTCVLTVIILIAILAQCGIAQDSSDKDEILMVVQKFFDSMTTRDKRRAQEILFMDGQFSVFSSTAIYLSLRY